MLPLNVVNTEEIAETTQGLVGMSKTTAMVQEIKRRYKINMLKSFIDQEAENVYKRQESTVTAAQTTA